MSNGPTKSPTRVELTRARPVTDKSLQAARTEIRGAKYWLQSRNTGSSRASKMQDFGITGHFVIQFLTQPSSAAKAALWSMFCKKLPYYHINI